MAKEYVELQEGAYRIGKNGVLLDCVVYEFQQGSSPEYIQECFPTLTLEQVYGAIAYYLANKEKLINTLRKGKLSSRNLAKPYMRRTVIGTKG